MSGAAAIGLLVWCILIGLVAWDEARREQRTVDDSEARKAFDERMAREVSGRDA
jgi:hypothetical protein